MFASRLTAALSSASRITSRAGPSSSPAFAIASSSGPAFVGNAQRFIRPYSTPTTLDSGEQAIYEKLKVAFPGTRLEVQDVSGGCGSFYAIVISSPAFKGLSTIKQHKLVNSCLKEDIKGIHGLQLKTIPE